MKIHHFRGGGEISPPLGPQCKVWTSDLEGLTLSDPGDCHFFMDGHLNSIPDGFLN